MTCKLYINVQKGIRDIYKIVAQSLYVISKSSYN